MIPPLNAEIRPLLEQLVAENDERGLQVAAYVNGELVLDTWAGVSDVRNGAMVSGDTLFPVFSVTKGVAATAIHLLAERGLLDYDAPVARYWPEFAANGKDGILVRHVMAHMAGLANMPENLDHVKLGSWDYMVQALANETPAHAPGEQQLYHAMTFGWLVGELVQRIDGRHFTVFLEDEIKAPLGIADMYCAIPDAVDSRIAWLEEDVINMPENLLNGPVPGWVKPLHTWMNRDDARRACIPASSGIMSAKAVARHYAALLPDGVDGVALLPPSRIALATERQLPSENPDEAPRFGLGYGLGGPDAMIGENGFAHGGYGGSIAFADPDVDLAFALCKNRFNDQGNTQKVVNRVRELLA